MRTPRSITLFVATTMLLSAMPVVAGLSIQDRTGILPLEVADAPSERIDVLEPGLLDKLDDGLRAVIVQFDDRVPSDLSSQVPRANVLYTFESIPALALVADAELVHTLASREDVRFIEDATKPLAFHLDSAVIASRAREVWDPAFDPPDQITTEPSPEIRDPSDNLIDGSGVGIAIVDSGIDATHPDLAAPGKVQANYLVTPTGLIEGGAYTEHASTHGTQMAGIAAGTGVAGDANPQLPARPGAAPGASLYGFATWVPEGPAVPGNTVLAPAIAFDWILENGADQDPPIRVVSNAWTCADPVCGAADGAQSHLQLAEQLADAGFVVVFSAGNDGGDGRGDLLTPEAKLSTRGILGVGNADDEDVGLRNDCTKSISSRGDAADPTTWPDLIAPGETVWAPQSIHPSSETRVPVPDNPTPERSQREYTSVTSTSASAAHIAGVAALVFQAEPGLGADEVEYILKATADKLPHGDEGGCVDYIAADPMHPWDGANYAAGHGIVDALDAVENATTFDGIPDLIEPADVPLDFLPIDPGLEPTHAFYLDGEDGLSQVQPGVGAPLVRYLGPGDKIVQTSEPLDAGFTADGVTAEAWMGTTAEAQVSFNGVDHRFTVERLPVGGGPAEVLIEDDFDIVHANPLNPVFRHESDLFEDPVTFEQGDRIQFTFEVEGTSAAAPAIGNTLLYSDARPFPARIEFGDKVDRPSFGSQAWCIESHVCTRLGGAHEYVSIACDSDSFEAIHVQFTGPAGSVATTSCDKATISCVVPGEPGSGEIGTCRAQTPVPHSYSGVGSCSYTLPDGTVGGSGHCAEGSLPNA